MSSGPRKLALTHAPTPLLRVAALDALVGTELWVKRDDMTAGPEAGNKIRKLEYLLADALEQRAEVVITCGGVQSNHARATALLARRLGMQPLLALRTTDGRAPDKPWHGNLFLDELVGADVRFITPAEYARRDVVLRELADEVTGRGQRACSIPEGGSNGLGALGYVDAMAEVRMQLDRMRTNGVDPAPPARFDAVIHACGSGGTAAGIALGAARHHVAAETIAIAVCDDRSYFERRIEQITREARSLVPELGDPSPLRILDAYKGPAYAVPSAEQVAFIAEVARTCGLILDPVYTGKALFGLSRMPRKPARSLFVHTGGLPGLLAEPDRFSRP